MSACLREPLVSRRSDLLNYIILQPLLALKAVEKSPRREDDNGARSMLASRPIGGEVSLCQYFVGRSISKT